ncbi:MAG: radical SAM-associated putative lipoprotein [Tannerellaceae bacterium]|jgi:putative lipoprotein (rSAM/lipoprotein system)|nr:radical SAM-associated putative lipoprotein [Tannerellaceae bacterium]
MKKKVYAVGLKWFGGWVLGSFLWVAASCSAGEDTVNLTDVPTANYIINGTVVCEKDTNLPIPGLQVVVSHAATHPSADTLFTGNDGKFAWEGPVTTFGKDLVFTITVTDIDEEQNKRYAPYTTRISFNKDELANEVSWFLGEAKKEVFIKMKEDTQ